MDDFTSFTFDPSYGPESIVWDRYLRMGFRVLMDGSKEFFRVPSVAPHPLRPYPPPVGDSEFDIFIKFHSTNTRTVRIKNEKKD